jgi:UDP-2,3-diacylglucosamine hydrolase
MKSSKKSRGKNGHVDETYHGDENEWLVLYCKEILEKEHFDAFIFGHRHLPLEINVGEKSTYYNLGEWINYNTYLEVSSEGALLKTWE